MCKDQLKGVHQAITGTLLRRRSTRGSSGASWEEPSRTFQDAMSWIAQQKVSTRTSKYLNSDWLSGSFGRWAARTNRVKPKESRRRRSQAGVHAHVT